MKLNQILFAAATLLLPLQTACTKAVAVEVAAAPSSAEQASQKPEDPKPEDPKPEEKKWISLFDGKTTDGWVNYGKDTISDGWQVVDGALTMVGGGGDIVTKDMFSDFELELEWKIAEGGNSGIFYGVIDGQSAVWASSPEMQVLDNLKHPDGKNVLTSAGACYALYPTTKNTLKKPGEWNKVGIHRKKNAVTHTMNGETICEYVIGSDDWNERIAKSKFKDLEHFAKSEKGRIALQDHGDRVSYRAIRIRKL